MTGVYPGSFDPFTLGHKDIVERAAKFCDKLYIAVSENINKKHLFTLEERVEMIREVFACNDNIIVESFNGLLVDYMQSKKAAYIIRGLRAVSDFEYEFQMAGMNRTLMPDVETIFLMPALDCQFVSGSFVREIAALGGDVSGFVPQPVRCALQQRFAMKKAQP